MQLYGIAMVNRVTNEIKHMAVSSSPMTEGIPMVNVSNEADHYIKLFSFEADGYIRAREMLGKVEAVVRGINVNIVPLAGQEGLVRAISHQPDIPIRGVV